MFVRDHVSSHNVTDGFSIQELFLFLFCVFVECEISSLFRPHKIKDTVRSSAWS